MVLPRCVTHCLLCHAGTTPWQLCGMDGLVPKPLTAAQLQTALQRVPDSNTRLSALTAQPMSGNDHNDGAAPAAGPATGADAACSSGYGIATQIAGPKAVPKTGAAKPSDTPQIISRASATDAARREPALPAAITCKKRELKRRGSILRRTSSGASAGSVVALQCGASTASSPGS